MDNKSKFKQFFKKEGFYVVLFVCLCAVATVAIITTSKDKKDVAKLPMVEQKQKLEDDSKTSGVISEDKTYNDALQVNKEELKPVPEVQVQKDNNGTATVSNTGKESSQNPVEGKLVRTYSEDPVYMKSTKDYRPHFGLDIKVEEGTPVVSMMDGVVKNVDVSSDGNYVEIDHQNGLVSVYSNLQEKALVKKGDAIKANQEVGKVGKTTTFAYEDYGTHLHFEVLKDGEHIDPSKYVSYKK